MFATITFTTAARPVHAADSATQGAQNKAVVLAYLQALQTRDLPALESFLGDHYVQHNPNIAPGKAGLVEFFRKLWTNNITLSGVRGPNPPIFIVAENDMVVLTQRHSHVDPDDPSKTYESTWFEAYRLEGGKIVEHWDPDLKRTQREPRATGSIGSP